MLLKYCLKLFIVFIKLDISEFFKPKSKVLCKKNISSDKFSRKNLPLNDFKNFNSEKKREVIFFSKF